jgi:hypothetical protein
MILQSFVRGTRGHRCVGLFIALRVSGALAKAPTVEDQREGPPEPSATHDHHASNIITLKVAYVEALDEVEAEREGEERAEGNLLTRHSAVGLGFEHVLVPGSMNAQIGALLFWGAEGAELPVSVLFEVPWEVSESAEFYVGAGFAADLLREDRLSPTFGIASAIGVYAWATDEIGANIDLEHRWVPSENRTYDLTVAIGAAARF